MLMANKFGTPYAERQLLFINTIMKWSSKMKNLNNTKEPNAILGLIKDLSLFEYTIAVTLIFAFAAALML